MCVSDPTRAARAGLTVTWDRPVAAVTAKPATVTSATTGASLKLTFADLGPAKGATQKITVRLG
ncbi:lyase [Streptomyces alboflavus]|uniref:Lyase n=1 Tax=Streptomyces alboflavus TaxID=67267 RepID=A0A1Z1W5N9_9ACTN|nr:lyase [Streptomyces alboflavus]